LKHLNDAFLSDWLRNVASLVSHARTHACTHACTHTRMHARTHACMHACMHAHAHAQPFYGPLGFCHHSHFTGQIPILPPNQQHQSLSHFIICKCLLLKCVFVASADN